MVWAAGGGEALASRITREAGGAHREMVTGNPSEVTGTVSRPPRPGPARAARSLRKRANTLAEGPRLVRGLPPKPLSLSRSSGPRHRRREAPSGQSRPPGRADGRAFEEEGALAGD